MSDTQAAMREFRFLDDKRKGGGLSHIEEQRWIDLGGQLGMSAQQGYYGQDGVWYAYPPGYDPNTGQYYGQQQPQYPGYAAPPQQYYDPNQPYYPPQDQQGYDPNGQYYDPNQPAYDPSQQAYDPNAQGYAPEQPAPYAPPAQWSHEEHPQAPGEWPQNYDPNTGQYYDPSGQAPAPSQPQYIPPPQYNPPPPNPPQYNQPQWQPPVSAPIPVPAYRAPAPVEDDGPLEVGEDEVMEVTDDDVTLLDSSPPLAAPEPAPFVPYKPLMAEKPLTKSLLEEPSAGADMFGDLRSSLSFDEPAPVPAPMPEPAAVAAAPALEVEPLLEATAEAELPAPAPVEPELPVVDLAPEPVAAAPAVVEPEPDIPVDLAPEPVAAAPAVVEPEPDIPVDLTPEPIAPAPVVAAPELPVDLTPEPIAAAPAVAPEPELPVDVLPEIEVAAPLPPAPAPEASFEPEIEEEAPAVEVASIMVADDLGAETFAAPVRAAAVDTTPDLPPLTELSAMLGGAQQPPPLPPPEPEAPSAPLALTMVAPISATTKDLYPDGMPALAAPAPPPPAPVSFELESAPKWEPPAADDIPDPRPSIPISIHVEEPVQEGSFDAEPILEASVEPEPEPEAPPPPSFEASSDDLPTELEPELPVSRHTGFEASLGDLPPAIANEPPPPIIDIDLAPPPSAPIVDFDVSIDDKPLPVEAPLDLGGRADEKVELAKTSDFLDFPTSSSADTSAFSVEGESLVESGTLATMANPPAAPSAMYAPIELPPEEPDTAVPLASNADFLGMSELNNTGEQWTKREGGVSFTEEPEPIAATIEEEPEDIIQGVALEEDSIDAEIQAELAEAVIEPEPWPAPLAMPPPPPPYSPAPPPPAPARPMAAVLPVPFVPKQPPAPFIPSPPPPRSSAATPVQPVTAGRDLSLFDKKGSLLRDEPGAPEIVGEHRVILHTVEGQVKRGVLRDTKLDDETVGLEATPGSVERIPRPRIKAIFFMLPAGQKAPTPKGDKLRVTFKDGRQLAGFSSDHRATGIGFFVVPADNRTNTERIFIYRSSVEKVAVD